MTPWTEMTTDERKEYCATRIASHMTYREIAAEAGASRNAVAGVVHRHKLRLVPVSAEIRRRQSVENIKKAHKHTRPKKKQPPRRQYLRPERPPEPVFAPKLGYLTADVWNPLPGAAPIAFVDVEHGQCRWMVGPVEDLLYCGHPTGVTASGKPSSYCQTHHDIGTTETKPLTFKKPGANP